MTVVENISWSELLKHTNLTAEHGNDGNRIATATETLQQAAHQFVQVINERARLLAKSAQFDAALRDAAAIVAILPASGLGYLCMGDVYCQQGHHSAAISIYDQGVEAVPESDAHYQHLRQHRMTATTKNSQHVDFISRLPLDIVVTNIIPRMELDSTSFTSFEPLYVSRAWQERILRAPKGLHFGFDGEKFNEDQAQIVKFAPYVQSLVGCRTDFHLDDLFSRAHFANLKELEINLMETTLSRPVMKGLQMVADSLTHLAISGCPHIQLRDLLESCPKLVSLNATDVELVMPSLPFSRFPKMSHLSLRNIEETALTYNNMHDVLSRFPSLLSLEITQMPESRVLTLLHEDCPYLQELYYGCRGNGDHEFDTHPNLKGVTTAHLGDEDFSYEQDDLIQFLHLHRHSLKTIDFGCSHINDNNCNWKLENGQVLQVHDHRDVPRLRHNDDPIQTKTVFTRLVNIDFSNCKPSSSRDFMIWLMSNAPNLKAIRLTESHFLPDVSNAMIKMSNLSKLEITKIKGTAEFFSPIISFMLHHNAMEDRSTLEELILHIDDGTMHAVVWLNLISQMKRLKDLILLTDVIPQYCLPTLANIARDCSSLESLTLGTEYGSYFTDGVITSLCPHPKLKYLTIGAKSLSAADFFALPTFPSLERLRLQYHIPHLTKDMLRKHIPKVIIE
ncbi:hypothetical protein O0I10_011735 [Lichtheimia ornata]|uniref:Uncharacterized protein n=1 Tax=Lichtheimia ornata TaxID=688661 RepID=A0AAD7UTT1_9FUNG|nr:uncharacterized protein O0I10_011735 [Lichtheimia ornata]KAJ8652589.1 hypothetical protein O0I10_011735 [Lichtheimia ornata]